MLLNGLVLVLPLTLLPDLYSKGAKPQWQMNCRQASLLVERKLTQGLPFWQQWRLSWHQRMCAVCKTYEQHSALIDEAMQAAQNMVYKLSDERKAAMLKRLKEIS